MIYNPKSHMGLKKPKAYVEPTHDEIQSAIRNFQGEGGLIRKLSDQTNPKMREVSVKYQNVIDEHFEELY